MRITADSLRNQVLQLNEFLGRPTELFSASVDGAAQANIGHLRLEEMSGTYRYRLIQIASINGGELNMSDRMTAREMYYFLSGMNLVRTLSSIGG